MHTFVKRHIAANDDDADNLHEYKTNVLSV